MVSHTPPDDRFDLLFAGGLAWTTDGWAEVDVGVMLDGPLAGRIAGLVPHGRAQAAERVDCRGLRLLPGVIDSQVHFREPGPTHKEDLETGSRAAVLGGVTTVFEMPNTSPPTDSEASLAEKLERARGRMWTDHAFWMGATAENAHRLGELEALPGAAGVKLFMGASTGDLLVADDEGLDRVMAHGARRIAVHAEDELRMQARLGLRRDGDPSSHPVWRDDESAMLATVRAVRAARRHGRPVHILHVTTPAELGFLAQHKDIASAEVTPQHLTLAGEDAYPRLGTWAQMNPPIRSAEHREGLWRWLAAGVVDVIGSDHAPHTLDEKARPYPASPSGMPGVQTLLPLLLTHRARGRLGWARLVDLTSAGPARLFGIAGKGRMAVGFDADLSIVDPDARWTVEPDWLASRCGWSPFTGEEMIGRPVHTVVRGRFAMRDGALDGAAAGRPVRFHATLERSA